MRPARQSKTFSLSWGVPGLRPFGATVSGRPTKSKSLTKSGGSAPRPPPRDMSRVHPGDVRAMSGDVRAMSGDVRALSGMSGECPGCRRFRAVSGDVKGCPGDVRGMSRECPGNVRDVGRCPGMVGLVIQGMVGLVIQGCPGMYYRIFPDAQQGCRRLSEMSDYVRGPAVLCTARFSCWPGLAHLYTVPDS